MSKARFVVPPQVRRLPRRLLFPRWLLFLACAALIFVLPHLLARPPYPLLRSADSDVSSRKPDAAVHAHPGTVAVPPKRGRFACSQKRFLGDAYGGWTLCVPATSLRGAVVYTVGVGRNIEWDKAMMREFGTVHHGWDPTPTAADFFSKRPPPPGFVFHRYGLGVRDGTAVVKLPEGNFDSYTIMGYAKRAKPGTVGAIDVRTVASMLRIAGHQRVAILKIDIEGAEFAVIEEWVRQGYRVPADQILLEFHERYFQGKKAAGLVPRAIGNMRRLGFEVFHRARLEISFIRVE